MVQELEEEMHLQHLMLAPLSHSSFMEFTDKVLPKLL